MMFKEMTPDANIIQGSLPDADPQAAAQVVEEVDVGQSLLLPSFLLC